MSALRVLFPGEKFETAFELIDTRCNAEVLGLSSDASRLLEQVRLSVLKCSKGDLESLEHVVSSAARDYRDVIVAARLGGKAYLEWEPTPQPEIITISHPAAGHEIAYLEYQPKASEPSDDRIVKCFNLRIRGCPLTRDRQFAGTFLLSDDARYIALPEHFSTSASSAREKSQGMQLWLVSPGTGEQALVDSCESGQLVPRKVNDAQIYFERIEVETKRCSNDCKRIITELQWRPMFPTATA